MKSCSKCLELKPLSNYSKASNQSSGLRPDCKACANTYRRKHYLLNSEKLKNDSLTHYNANKEYYSNWAKTNKDFKNANYAKRRAIKKQSLPSWANLQAISAIYAEAKLISEETGIPHEVDHLEPLQHPLVCGLHCEANMQILTRAENRRKHNTFTPWILSEVNHR